MRQSRTTRSAGRFSTASSRSRPMPRSPNAAIIENGECGSCAEKRRACLVSSTPNPAARSLSAWAACPRNRTVWPRACISRAIANAGGTLPPPSQVTKRMSATAHSRCWVWGWVWWCSRAVTRRRIRSSVVARFSRRSRRSCFQVKTSVATTSRSRSSSGAASARWLSAVCGPRWRVGADAAVVAGAGD